jgi:enolase-phosphatase E1
MSQDRKVSYLKSLQGYLWLKGYESGDLKCPLFPDVYPAMQAWHNASVPIVIYSSGSVPAQKLLFQYTNSSPDPDLRPLISDYFDTVNAGPKTEKVSYEKIAKTRKEAIGQWLFLSDNLKEVEAAKAAGMQSLVVFREGNAPLSDKDRQGHGVIESFNELRTDGNS